MPSIHAGKRVMLKQLIPYLSALAVAAVIISWVTTAPAQSGVEGEKAPKKGPGKKGAEVQLIPDRLDRLRRELQYARTADPERQTLLVQAGVFANKADQIWRTQQPYIADRTLAAAEALFHASDHLEHLTNSQQAPPPLPPAEATARHLAQVYFRTREADYFLQEIHDASASPLVTLARQYYQRAVQSYDRSDLRGADEYGKTAEELVRALESLAQAATIAPQRR